MMKESGSAAPESGLGVMERFAMNIAARWHIPGT
jgi:hypothetical protein